MSLVATPLEAGADAPDGSDVVYNGDENTSVVIAVADVSGAEVGGRGADTDIDPPDWVEGVCAGTPDMLLLPVTPECGT